MAKIADKINGSVRHKGTTYKAGDEEKFAATKPDKADLQRLADKGVIAGFGTGASDDDSEDGTTKGKKKK